MSNSLSFVSVIGMPFVENCASLNALGMLFMSDVRKSILISVSKVTKYTLLQL